MNEIFISKKELLELYGFSYGALYRWKRTGLIPESWFIRKSTATGQETFFERDKICPRIELILSRKDGSSLEELAKEFNGERIKKEQSRSLVIETKYGKYSYPLNELLSCTLVSDDESKLITEILKEMEL